MDAMDGVHHTTAGNALSALFNRHVYSMPLRAFRPPNEPLRYSGMLLRYFNALQVGVRRCRCWCMHFVCECAHAHARKRCAVLLLLQR